MKLDESRKTGVWGEVLAARYLRGMGFSIYTVNFRIGHAEIDIVAEKDGVVHIVEVKTRAPGTLLPPGENAGGQKQRNLLRAAGAVKKLYRVQNGIRFDIMEVVFTDRQHYRLRFLPDALSPERGRRRR